MPQNRGSGLRTRRLGAVVAATALAAVVTPAVAQAQETSGSDSSLPSQTGNSSVDSAIGMLPAEIIVGEPGIGGGSEGLREAGSGAVPEVALSAGQVLGSVAPLEALGSTGGSAVASVASSGSLPGSVYANPTGSIGSGTIGLGSIAIPEYIFPVLSLQFFGGFFTALGERQEAGELYPHELNFWHDIVVDSAEGGAFLEDAAADAGTELPGGLAGSIDAVQRSALQDPFEENERRRTLAEAAAQAEAAGETGDEAAQATDDDDNVADSSPADTPGDERGAQTGVGEGLPTLTAAGGPVEPAAQVPAAQNHAAQNHSAQNHAAQNHAGQDQAVQAAAPATLAATGVETTAIAGLAVVSLLFGTFLLAASRRRA